MVEAVAPEAFGDAVVAVLRALRPGEVVTYGEVAAEAGRPGAARAVGRLLADSGGTLPWWRVVTAAGRLVPGREVDHARLLEAEGVVLVAGRVRRGPGDPSARSGPARPRRAGNNWVPEVVRAPVAGRPSLDPSSAQERTTP